MAQKHFCTGKNFGVLCSSELSIIRLTGKIFPPSFKLLIITTRQMGGLLLAYKAKGLKPRLKSHAFTYVQAYCSLSPAGPKKAFGTTYYP